MSEPVEVNAFPNGPFKLKGVRELVYNGETLAAQGTVYLCRCGESKNAPFCDGSHQTAGFSSDNPKARTKDVVVWEGQRVRTRFNPNACMHVFYCKPLAELRKAELAHDGAEGQAAAEEIMRVVRSCPSGALSYEVKGEQADIAAESGQEQGDGKVEVIAGGEIRIGRFTGIDPIEGLGTDKATLCRCGLSKNKPYCDGRHKQRKDFV